MTTIVGLNVIKGKNKGVVLASDMASTYEYKDDRGNIIVKKQGRISSQKIYVSKNRDFALAMSGIRDEAYLNFLRDLLVGKMDLKEALDKDYLSEFSNLNLKRWGYKSPNDDFNSLMIASRFDGIPRLHIAHSLGALEEIKGSGYSMGSGSEFALKYLREKSKRVSPIKPEGVNMKEALKLAYGAIESASEDVYTGGADIGVITSEGIELYGKQINKAVQRAKSSALSSILNQY